MNPQIDELERRSQDFVISHYRRRILAASALVDHEFDLIRHLGQEDAFLAAFKLSRFLSENRIAAKLIRAGPNSIVAFVIGLSEVDPLRHGLLAERFLIAGNDWSVDFCIVVDEARMREVDDFIADIPKGSDFFSIYAGAGLEMVPARTVAVIRKRGNPDFRLEAIPFVDGKTTEELQSRNTSGLFQLESDEVREALSRMKSPGIEQIAALTSVRQPVQAEAGLLAAFVERAMSPVRKIKTSQTIQKIFAETNGLILYQEQIMSLLHNLGGIPLATAYRFIKDVSKRKPVASIREQFLKSAIGSTLSSETANELIDDLQTAARYASLKSHYLAIAVTTWQAAYLKAHFRREFDEVVENAAVENH